MRVVIIGAGPAGMMAGIESAKMGIETIIVEKNTVVGKKLNITGKGRCNLTHSKDNEYFFDNVVSNSRFLYSANARFNNNDLVSFTNDLGVETKEERGNRVFLKSDDATSLTNALLSKIKELGVKLMLGKQVKKVLTDFNGITGVELSSGETLGCEKVVIATGGKSYPATGSTGDGYTLAKELGHTVTSIRPALVPMRVKEVDIVKSVEGLNLKNVKLTVIAESIELDSRFGELLFTSKGVSGPIVLSSSSKITRVKNIDELMKQGKVKIYIDFKPALTEQQLYTRITKDFKLTLNKEVKNSLNDLLPKSIIPVILELWKIDLNKKVNSVTAEEKNILVKLLKEFTLTVVSLEDVATGIVTSGGVSVKEINPSTMESKLVKGLFFAGEIIDVDGYTGGFNLQIAFSTGYLAGKSI